LVARTNEQTKRTELAMQRKLFSLFWFWFVLALRVALFVTLTNTELTFYFHARALLGFTARQRFQRLGSNVG